MKFEYNLFPISSCFNNSEGKLLGKLALVNTLNTSLEGLKLISSLFMHSANLSTLIYEFSEKMSLAIHSDVFCWKHLYCFFQGDAGSTS